jgi:hypothetical protein
MLPVDIPEFQLYPRVHAFVRDHLSMQFGDVRSMMRLPLPHLGITHACNFAATAVLCNLISGISVSLYLPPNAVRTNEQGEKQYVGAGTAFKLLLEHYYPWQPRENRQERARVLYDLFRNQLAHTLGVGKADYVIFIRRFPGPGLQENQLKEIECSASRPTWLVPGLSGYGKQWDLLVEGFYSDVFHMLWKL